MVAHVTIRDNGDLKRLSRSLNKHGNAKALRKQLTKGIRDELKPASKKIKAAYRSNPSRAGTRRLRAALARSTRVEVRTSGKNAGALIRVDGRKMPSGMGRIPQLYEGIGTWRHPVFGGTRYVAQEPHPTFFKIARSHSPRVRKAIEHVADAVAKKID